MIKHENFIFVHLQKCAGSTLTFTLEEILKEENNNNYKITDNPHVPSNNIPDEERNEKVLIGSIRNPYDWYCSSYFHLKRTNSLYEDIESFSDYVKFVMFEIETPDLNRYDIASDKNIGLFSANFINLFWDHSYISDLSPRRSKFDFYDIHEEAFNIDELIHVEDLENDFYSVLEDLGIYLPRKEIPKTNKNEESINYSTMYNDFLIDIIKYKDKYLLDLFNYSFDDIK